MRGSASRFVLLLAALSLAVPVPAQVNIDACRDYFLVGRFGEVHDGRSGRAVRGRRRKAE